VEAIRAAAVAGNGEPDSFRIIGRWEGEFTARQWNKRLDLGSGQPGTSDGSVGFDDKPAWDSECLSDDWRVAHENTDAAEDKNKAEVTCKRPSIGRHRGDPPSIPLASSLLLGPCEPLSLTDWSSGASQQLKLKLRAVPRQETLCWKEGVLQTNMMHGLYQDSTNEDLRKRRLNPCKNIVRTWKEVGQLLLDTNKNIHLFVWDCPKSVSDIPYRMDATSFRTQLIPETANMNVDRTGVDLGPPIMTPDCLE